MNLLDNFQRYIRRNELAAPEDFILLTVSGGVDSMVMLSLFVRSGYRVGVAHCNFQLRGVESEEDEELVRREAEKYGVPWYNKRFDTKGEMERTGESMEMAARRLRYAWFDELSREHGYTVVAIAHHIDDSIETFFIDALCDLLASTILQESERAFNQLTVYGRDSDAGQVVNLCRQMPMMGSYQVVILKEAQQLRGLDKLSLYTSKPSPTTILIVCHKEKNVDKRSQLYKSIAQHGAVLESVRPRDYEIGPWLAQFVASKGCTIDAKAQAMLTDHLGTDLAKISNELGKLLLSLPEGTKKITDAHIEQNIGISKDFNNFELCKAVTGQNLEQALRIADHFARNPKDNPLLVTILALFNQFREIFRINYLRWLSRHKGVPFPSDTELIGILRMNNAYALGELKQTSARWDNRRVFRILGLLREYDAKSKGMNAGGAPDGELLRELLLKIFLQ